MYRKNVIRTLMGKDPCGMGAIGRRTREVAGPFQWEGTRKKG